MEPPTRGALYAERSTRGFRPVKFRRLHFSQSRDAPRGTLLRGLQRGSEVEGEGELSARGDPLHCACSNLSLRKQVARRLRGACGPRGGLLRPRSLRITVKTMQQWNCIRRGALRAEHPRECVAGLNPLTTALDARFFALPTQCFWGTAQR